MAALVLLGVTKLRLSSDVTTPASACPDITACRGYLRISSRDDLRKSLQGEIHVYLRVARGQRSHHREGAALERRGAEAGHGHQRQHREEELVRGERRLLREPRERDKDLRTGYSRINSTNTFSRDP